MQRLFCVWIARRSDRPRRLPLAGHCARSLRRPVRPGWTVLELIVVITITALLLALLLPAIGAVRESARRMDCSTRLREMVLACHQYEWSYGGYPIGAHLRIQLLPLLGQSSLYDQIESYQFRPFAAPASPTRDELLSRPVREFLCPSEPAVLVGGLLAPANYAGNYGSGIQRFGYDGFFCTTIGARHAWLPQIFVRARDITDGLSNTAALSELLPNDGTHHRLRAMWSLQTELLRPDEYSQFRELCRGLPSSPAAAGVVGNAGYAHAVPWMEGGPGNSLYNHMLPPNCPSCNSAGWVQYGAYSASSLHGRGVNVVYGDGHVAFVSESIDGEVWREMGSRGPSQFLDQLYNPDA